MQRGTLGCEEAACAVLERLADRLPEASVEYQCGAGVHYFFIRHGATRFKIQFSEQTLTRKSAQDLDLTVAKVVERVLSSTSPRPLADR